jgi:hypothetical protein
MEWKAFLGNEDIWNGRGRLFVDFFTASLSPLIQIRQRPNGHLFQNSHQLVWKYILISLRFGFETIILAVLEMNFQMLLSIPPRSR